MKQAGRQDHNSVSGDGIPVDTTSERAVLGALLLDPNAYGHICPVVSVDDFYLQVHRYVYEELRTIIEEGSTPDVLTVHDRLIRRGSEPDGGWSAFLTQLVNYVPETSNAGAYARIVREYAVRRRMIVTGRQMATAAADITTNLDETLAMAESSALNMRGSGETGLRSAQEVADDYLARFDEQCAIGLAQVGISTGYPDIDRIILGLEPQPYLAAGRPGMGKSSLLLDMCLDMALRRRLKVALFSLEMSATQLMNRAISYLTKIPLASIRAPGSLTEKERYGVRSAINYIRGSQLFIDCTPGLSPSQIRARSLRKKMQWGRIDFVGIDHVHIMAGDIPGLSGTALVTHLSKELMRLPKVLDAPVMYLAQLSRAVELRQDKRPQLSDLRDSGSLEEDAYAVMFVYRDDYYDPLSERPNQAEINIAKNRDGETGKALLYWSADTTSFRTLQRQ